MSESWVAFLRGMNVGGHRITNADLAAHFEAMGFTDVRTYRASGNVMFAATGEADPATRIEQGLHAALGYAVPTFLRSHTQLQAAVAAQPFTAAQQSERGKVQIAFLGAAPRPDIAAAVLDHASDDDLLQVRGTELYWLPRVGISTSELDFKAVDRLLGPYTVRTLGTVQNILKKLG